VPSNKIKNKKMENLQLPAMPDIIKEKLKNGETPEKRRNKIGFKAKLKIGVVCFILLLAAIIWATIMVAEWFNSYTLQIRSPFQNPVVIEERVSKTDRHILPVAHAEEAEAAPDPLTLIERMICDKFGDDCLLALAVSHAENGTRQCDRFNQNTNGTRDWGIFQINEVHLKKGYTIADLTDCQKNIDIAFEIYRVQGFDPWVVYQKGSYIRSYNHYVGLLK